MQVLQKYKIKFPVKCLISQDLQKDGEVYLILFLTYLNISAFWKFVCENSLIQNYGFSP